MSDLIRVTVLVVGLVLAAMIITELAAIYSHASTNVTIWVGVVLGGLVTNGA